MIFRRPHNDPLTEALQSSTGGHHITPVARERMRSVIMAEFQRVTQQDGLRFKGMSVSSFKFSTMIPAIIAIVILVSGVGVATASNSAKPGDFFYPVDRTVEAIRLDLATNAATRARLQAQFAQERELELNVLREKNSDHSSEAEKQANEALDAAVDRLSEVERQHDERGDTSSGTAIGEVEQKLEEIRSSREQRERTQLTGLTEAEATIRGTSTTVNIEYNDTASTFTVASTAEDSIVQAIVDRTGASSANVRAVLKIEREDEPETNENTNRGANTNVSVNTNSRQEDNEDQDDDRNTNTNSAPSVKAEIRVEVKVEKGTSEIHATVDGREQEWSLNSTDQTAILLSIAAKTGLTSAAIMSAWEYRIDS